MEPRRLRSQFSRSCFSVDPRAPPRMIWSKKKVSLEGAWLGVAGFQASEVAVFKFQMGLWCVASAQSLDVSSDLFIIVSDLLQHSGGRDRFEVEFGLPPLVSSLISSAMVCWGEEMTLRTVVLMVTAGDREKAVVTKGRKEMTEKRGK